MFALLCPLLALSQSAPDGLVHRWTLAPDSHTKGVLQDGVGPLNLSLSGAPEFVGKDDQGALIVGDKRGGGERLVTPDELPEESMTAEGWILIQKATPYATCVGAIEDNGDHERGFMLGTQNDRFVFAVSSVGLGKLSFVRAPEAFELNRWYHLAGVYDGEVISLYVDGVEVVFSEQPAGPLLYDDSHKLTVGVYQDKDERYALNGLLSGVGIYDRALRGRTIERNATSGRASLPDPETTKDEVADEAPNFQIQVDGAVGRGVQWLLQRQHRDGSWGQHVPRYRNGQTALSLLTLMECGLPASHPAVVLGFEFLERRDPTMTYSAGVQLLAIAASGEHKYRPMAERIVDLLLEWESTRIPGSWGYPMGAEDLSCTQFAAMGFWAASEMGIKVPKAVWQRMVETTIADFSGDVSMLEGAKRNDRSMAVQGYVYNQHQANPRGSMTIAALGVFAFAEVCTGNKLGARFQKMLDRSRPAAMNWMAQHWAVNKNPVQGGPPHYYLYGLERVGALLQTDTLVGHDWYKEGGEFLVEKQRPDGAWGGASDTCFAMLFLVRATGPISGGPRDSSMREWGQREGSVQVQIFGDLQLTMFITDFDSKLLKEHKDQEKAKAGLRIAKVDWLIDGAIVNTQDADPKIAWSSERFPFRWTAPREKNVQIQVQVHAVPVGDYADSYATAKIYRSTPLAVPVRRSSDEFTEHLMGQSYEDLLDGQVTVATCSSQYGDHNGADKAIDNLGPTTWLTTADDAAPWIRVEVDDPLKVSEVVLGSPNSSIAIAGGRDAPTRVRIIINKGRIDFETDLPEDDLLPAVVRLPRRTSMRSIEVHILERRNGREAGVTGFSELSVR